MAISEARRREEMKTRKKKHNKDHVNMLSYHFIHSGGNDTVLKKSRARIKRTNNIATEEEEASAQKNEIKKQQKNEVNK